MRKRKNIQSAWNSRQTSCLIFNLWKTPLWQIIFIEFVSPFSWNWQSNFCFEIW